METVFKPNAFITDIEIPWEDVGKGTKRKIMAYDEKVMQVKVAFETGAVGSLHQHYHIQLTYISKGIFEVEIDGEKQVMKAGDVFYVAPNLIHGVVCLEAGELIDVFNPIRQDFI